jgi:hypothetical protein
MIVFVCVCQVSRSQFRGPSARHLPFIQSARDRTCESNYNEQQPVFTCCQVNACFVPDVSFQATLYRANADKMADAYSPNLSVN